MRMPDDPEKYSNRWKWVEAARWRQDQHGAWKVMREMVRQGEGRPSLPAIYEWSDIEKYADKYQRLGIYTSVFRYDDTNLDRAVRLGSLYFDIDSDDIERSRRETQILAEFFLSFIPRDALRIYFTGKKGFHIELEALALGITGSNELPAIFRHIANDLKAKFDLEHLDFQVYDLRRMWRLPNTIHQSTGLYKRELSYEELGLSVERIQQIATGPADYEVPEQTFNLAANEWYREYTYKFEEAKLPKKYTTEDMLERFNKHGSTMLRGVGDMQRQFDPVDLFDNCKAIYELWKKAETKHHLEHEERLFLCSILSYTDEALEYLHAILSNCSDYNFEKSQAHIDDWIRRREMGIGGRPFSCERANAAGIGCGNCNLEPRKKWVKVGDSWIESDEESKPSPVRFAYKSVRN